MIFKFEKYKSWFGVYQLCDKLQYFGLKTKTTNKIAEYLGNTWVQKFLEWIHSKKKQKIVVKVESHDTWNVDFLLAHIIHPLLVKLKTDKAGTPNVDNNDVPEHLHNVDAYCPEKWEWVLDEMIWSFERIIKDDLDEYVNKLTGQDSICEQNRDMYFDLNKRVRNGTRLFGVYYQSLWS